MNTCNNLEIKKEISKLDNLYTLIVLLHERGEFEKAFELFREASECNRRITELKKGVFAGDEVVALGG